MSRRPIAAPVIDHRRDRLRWRDLIRDAHAVAAGEGRVTPVDLGANANQARNMWAPLAGYPDGVVCNLFATATWAWARSVDGERREQLKGMMLTTAGMVDELMTATEVAVGVDPSPRPSVTVYHETPARLPYRED